MEMALTFNDITFSPVTHQNNLWIRAVELAHALGYAQENSVSRIYRSNSDEFTPDMTQVIEIFDGADSALPTKIRIFSLRGCHLLAMFARTPVAKQFRRWVLDVIEQYGDRVPVEPSALPDESPAFPGSVSVTPSTVEDRKPLRSLVNAWAQVSAQPFNVCWTQLKAAFRLSDIRDLPQEWIPDALAWVQEKIDALPASSQPLPAGSSMLPEGFPADMEAGRKDALRKIRSIINAMEAARGVVSLFCYPPKRTMDMPRAQRLAYEANHDFYNAALDCLTAAHMALEAGYVLGRTGKMKH